MAITKGLRFEILRRDNFRCTYCGATPAKTELHVDHVLPTSLGGTDDPSNLTTACQDCNAGKAGRMLDEPQVEAVNERAKVWAQAMEQAIEERRKRFDALQEIREWFRFEWESWTPRVELPDGFVKTINHYLVHGLSTDEIVDSIEIAMTSPTPIHRKYRYFCGVCNRKLDDLRMRAMEIVEEYDA